MRAPWYDVHVRKRVCHKPSFKDRAYKCRDRHRHDVIVGSA